MQTQNVENIDGMGVLEDYDPNRLEPIIDEHVKKQLLEVQRLLQIQPNRSAKLNKQISNRIILFKGTSASDKNLAVSWLSKIEGAPIYHVHINKLVSPYIGETEKNLQKLLRQAEEKKAILYFDEADALFGKRTNVNDAHDKFANQEVSYLQLKAYPGLVVLSSLKGNLDDAFKRRLQAIIDFPPKKK